MARTAVAALAAGAVAVQAFAQQAAPAPASAVPPEEETTNVEELVVRGASLRPPSDVPRFAPQTITALADFARERHTLSLRNEGRAARSMVTTHGARPRTATMMGAVDAAEGTKRGYYRQLEVAAMEAEKATVNAETVFQAWLRNERTREDLIAAERAREVAVNHMLEVRTKAMEGIEGADTQLWGTLVQVAMETSQTSDDPNAQEQPGLTPAEQEAVYRAMEEREYRLAAEAASRALKFENVTVLPVTTNGAASLRISGVIRNNADVRTQVPPFNIVFYDQDNQAFAGMVVQPDASGVAANGVKRFAFNVASSPGARITRVALVFGHPSFRPRPAAR